MHASHECMPDALRPKRAPTQQLICYAARQLLCKLGTSLCNCCDSPGMNQADQAPDRFFCMLVNNHCPVATLTRTNTADDQATLFISKIEMHVELPCQHGIKQALSAVKTAWQQCKVFCPGRRFRISRHTCGQFPILCSYYINNAKDVWRPRETLDYENGSLELVC